MRVRMSRELSQRTEHALYCDLITNITDFIQMVKLLNFCNLHDEQRSHAQRDNSRGQARPAMREAARRATALCAYSRNLCAVAVPVPPACPPVTPCPEARGRAARQH